jgi:membrane protein DedA with SNARE-associated domain/rhodanese-related sulfurtransferase
MEKLLHFIAVHGPLVIFAVAFGNELCLPFPSELMFLQVGALVAQGEFPLLAAILLPLGGTLVADLCLYYMGRRSGLKFLRILTRYSLQPEALSRQTEGIFGRGGLRFLLISKFLPMSMVPPLTSGMTGIRLLRFTLYSAAGTVIWVSLYTAIGFLASHQIAAVVQWGTRVTGALAGIGGVLFAVYMALKLIQRRRILRRHHEALISPELLKARMDSGERVTIVDVRNREGLALFPYVIPGSLVIPQEDIEHHRKEIPADQEFVLYCSCPNEVSSARIALKLNQKNIGRVHALAGGIDAWHALQFPLEGWTPETLNVN